MIKKLMWSDHFELKRYYKQGAKMIVSLIFKGVIIIDIT